MNKWMKELKKIEGAVTRKYDPYAHIIRTPSPSTNWTFSRTHGLPLGYSILFWGPPKAGKTLLSNATVGQLHRDDPKAIVVKFDTEMRDEGQMSDETAAAFGIDLERYIVFQVNKPMQVFNVIKDKLGAMIRKGAPIKLIIIDSITGVLGRVESQSKKGVMQFGMGDHAQTVQIGLKSCCLELQRQHRISLIVTAHARAEMDQMRQKQGYKTKAAASFGVLHHCEYFMMVDRNSTKKGRTDVLGHEMVDDSLTDFKGNSERTGHKIRCWMQGSTVGTDNRCGEFTVDYNHGIINAHHEAFSLGIKWGIIKHPDKSHYIINGASFHGAPKAVAALRDPQLQAYITAELIKMEAERRAQALVIKDDVEVDETGDETGEDDEEEDVDFEEDEDEDDEEDAEDEDDEEETVEDVAASES